MFKTNYLIKFILMIMILIAKNQLSNANVIRGLFEAATNGLFGMPIIHKETDWDFKPDLGEKYRSSFYEQHGYRADKLVQRIGLGHDGMEDQRVQQQALRDVGRLNGEHFVNFP